MSVNSRIGGQAVMEGIMMRGGDQYAIAVRKPDGEIVVKVEDIKNSEMEKKLLKIPIVRGVFSFISSMVVGIKTLMYSASFFEDDEEEKVDISKLSKEELAAKEKKDKRDEKIFVTGTLLLSLVLAIGIFMVLPYFLMHLMERFTDKVWLLSLFESVVRIVIFLAYIILISKVKDIQRTFMYHGAEHKCINCVEHGLPLNVENVLKSSRFHKRCGTSFLFFVVIVSAVLLMLIQAKTHLARIIIRILLIPVVAGLSYEIIRLAGSSDGKFMSMLSKPGLGIQKFTTNEPDASMAEVAIAAVEAVFDWRAFLKKEFDLDVPALTYNIAARQAARMLREAGVPEDFAVAKKLVLFVNGIDNKTYMTDRSTVMTDTKRLELMKLVERRINGEPVQYITGEADFYGHEFRVTPDVLIPRFDTENLVNEALKHCQEGTKVLDLCTGSGCIIISMCKEMKINGTGSDISEKALAVARENAKSLEAECDFVESDLFADINGRFDVIVSNPPYIRKADIAGLEDQVKDHEPMSALDGGDDGLDYYRKITKEAADHLNAGGVLLFEIGFDQAAAVTSLLGENGYENIEVVKDINGLDRVVKGQLAGNQEQ